MANRNPSLLENHRKRRSVNDNVGSKGLLVRTAGGGQIVKGRASAKKGSRRGIKVYKDKRMGYIGRGRRGGGKPLLLARRGGGVRDIFARPWRAGERGDLLVLGYLILGTHLNIQDLFSRIAAPQQQPPRHCCCTGVTANHPSVQQGAILRAGEERKVF